MSTPPNSPNSGQRRAARRVQQRKRQDSTRWTTNGRLRPQSSSNRRQVEHIRPWNDRFIYDEESVKGAPRTRKAIAQRPWRSEGKENGAMEDTGGSSTRHYTERADGEAVAEYSRLEVAPSTQVEIAEGQHHTLVGRSSVGVSPFDLEKVRAALEADASDAGEEADQSDEPDDQRPRQPLHDPAENRNALSSLQLSGNSGKVLERLQDLLLTIELEEGQALERVQDLAGNPNHSEADTAVFVGPIPAPTDQSTPQTVALPRERQEKILEHAQARRLLRYQQEKPIVKNGSLRYSKLCEALADQLLDSCINDIAEELGECIQSCSEQVFRQL